MLTFDCSEEDFKITETEIIDFLNENNYELCIEEKDFVLGQTKQTNLSAAMEYSRRMICYVTRYIKS